MQFEEILDEYFKVSNLSSVTFPHCYNQNMDEINSFYAAC